MTSHTSLRFSSLHTTAYLGIRRKTKRHRLERDSHEMGLKLCRHFLPVSPGLIELCIRKLWTQIGLFVLGLWVPHVFAMGCYWQELSQNFWDDCIVLALVELNLIRKLGRGCRWGGRRKISEERGKYAFGNMNQGRGIMNGTLNG